MTGRCDSDDAGQVWQLLLGIFTDTRDDWRRTLSEATGMPFSRMRVMRHLLAAPLTLKQLADATGSDAPATTLAVNDLENRGLVERHPHPESRRAKLVSLTPAGRQLIEQGRRAMREAVPPKIQDLSKTDLAHLRRILQRISPREP